MTARLTVVAEPDAGVIVIGAVNVPAAAELANLSPPHPLRASRLTLEANAKTSRSGNRLLRPLILKASPRTNGKPNIAYIGSAEFLSLNPLLRLVVDVVLMTRDVETAAELTVKLDVAMVHVTCAGKVPQATVKLPV